MKKIYFNVSLYNSKKEKKR